MARIAYNSHDAAAFEATRHLTDQALAGWREAVAKHLNPQPGTRLLDLGAGTGMWARAFTDWYDNVDVIAVEPSEAMRARCHYSPILAGDASNLPLKDNSVDAAWLSTMIHHVPDLTAAARELRRVVRAGGPVLIRSAFRRPTPGDHTLSVLHRSYSGTEHLPQRRRRGNRLRNRRLHRDLARTGPADNLAVAA